MTSTHKKLEHILFLDIETAAIVSDYKELSEPFKKLWTHKAGLIARQPLSQSEVAELFKQKAGIYAEFSKVVCISIGYINKKKSKTKTIRTKSFYGDDEIKLLKSFCKVLNKFFHKPKSQFICGHNIREFDIPFICRRLLINQLPLPGIFDIQGKKPWEVKFILDTLQMWKFGDYKSFASLDLLATTLGVTSSKDGMNGSDVHDVYWNQNDISAIVEYCEKDIYTTAKVYLRLSGADVIV